MSARDHRHTCKYFKGVLTYGDEEYREINGKRERLIVCCGVGDDNDKDWAPLNKRCAECNKYAYSEYVDKWVRGEE